MHVFDLPASRPPRRLPLVPSLRVPPGAVALAVILALVHAGCGDDRRRGADGGGSDAAAVDAGRLDGGAHSMDAGEDDGGATHGDAAADAGDGGTTTPDGSADAAVASCDDGVHNGDETDVDCGGGTCPRCPPESGCLEDADCLSSICQEDTCNHPGCGDGLLNGDETDLDCGGTCVAGCEVGQSCTTGSDCESGVCEGGTCQAAT